MKKLAKYHFSNHCVIGEKTFKNILIGPGKLPGLSRNGPQEFRETGWFTNSTPLLQGEKDVTSVLCKFINDS